MSRLPSTGPSLQRWLRQQERKAQRQQQSSAFARSGTTVVAEDVTEVDGTLDVVGALIVDGTETVNGPLAVHGTAAFDGDTTIGGNAAITGTLSLPAGIIGNDALTSPVVPQAVYFNASNFSLNTSPAVKASQTITVPAGFTSAVVSVTARIYAANPNTTGGMGPGGDYLYGKATIDGADCIALPVIVLGSGSSGVSVSSFSVVKTGLTPGGTFVISAVGITAYLTWAAYTTNVAEVSGFIQWFR